MAKSPSELDREDLYGRYNAAEDWQARLYRAGAHKALNIPDLAAMPKIDASRRGIGGLAAIGIAALAGGIPTAAIVASQFANTPPACIAPLDPAPRDPAPPDPAAPAADTDTGIINLGKR